jgi:tetratricopeptide (TPR) repeat protein
VAIARGDYPKAVDFFEKSLERHPDSVELLTHKAFAFISMDRHALAKPILERALVLAKSNFVANKLMGIVFAQESRFDQAEAYFRLALEVQPADSEIHSLLGKALMDMNRHEEAVPIVKQAIKLNRNSPIPFNLMGSIYRHRCRFRTALSFYRHGLRVSPADLNSNTNYGVGLLETGRVHEAIRHMRSHLEVDSTCHMAHFNLATALLLVGNLQEGWEAYEARRHILKLRDVQLSCPEWQGESLEEKTLLVFAEQGLGDEILVASMYSDAIRQAEKCYIECEPRLLTLFQRSFPEATFLPRVQNQVLQSASQSFSYKTLGFSLARWLRNSIDDFPGNVGYLKPANDRVDFWRWRVAQLGRGLKVGISWRSMLNTGIRKAEYTSLDEWGAIFKIPGIRFINLQYDRCQEELDEAAAFFGVEIANFKDVDLKDDMEDVAAIISGLDVVISAGNAVAMMAGALNVPVLLFAGVSNSWTCHGTDRVPWFPSFQAFFRPWDKDWTDVLNGIATEVSRRSQAKATNDENPGIAKVDESAMLLQRIGRGALLLQSGQAQKARAICDEVLSLRGSHEEALVLLGKIEYAEGNLERAKTVLRRATDISPLYAEAFNHLGIVLLAESRTDEAVAEFDHALNLRPNYPDALSNLGNAYIAKSEHERALQCYQRAIATFAGHVVARYNYAMALEDTGHFSEAVVEYETVLDGNPRYAEAWNNLGNLYAKLGHAVEAESAFRKALSANPHLMAAHVNLGKLLMRGNKEIQEAIQLFETVMAVRPEDAGMANTVGAAYASSGDFEKSVEYFRRALAINPNSLEAIRNLAMVLQRLGRLDEAKKVLLQGVARHTIGQ